MSPVDADGFVQQVLTAAPEGMAVLEAGRFVSINEEFATTFHYEDPAALVGSSVDSVFSDEAVDRLTSSVLPDLDDDERWDGRITGNTRDGDRIRIRVTVSAVPATSDRERAVLLSVADPSSGSHVPPVPSSPYKTVLQNIHDAVYTLDADGRITWVNDVAVEEFDGGYTSDELVGSYVTKILSPSDIERCSSLIRWMVRENRDNATTEVSLLTADGEEIPTELHLSLLPFEDGEFRGTVGVGRDITDRKRREQQFAVLNRILRHNVRNDMNVIRGHADLLAEDIDLEGNRREHVEAIRKTTSNLVSLSEKARSLARVAESSASPSETTSASELLRTVCDEYEGTYPDATIDRSIPDDSDAAIDTGFEIALENLVENAIVHNDSEAVIVAVELSERTDGVVEMSIADNGPGIHPEEVTVLESETEEPLEHGSGIGLWLMKWVVTVLDGDVAFDESETGGTAVTITAPVIRRG